MDTLALLCNLHADGPATLQVLRREGCDSLATLLTLEPDELARRLEWNPRTADRFLREAVHLAERIEDSSVWDDSEESEVLESEELEVHGVADVDVLGAESDDDEAPEAPPATAAAQVESVLGRWRDLDRTDPPTSPVEPPASAARELPGYVVEPRRGAAGAPATRPLSAVALPSLNSELARRLEALGILSLGALAAAPTTDLAQQLPLAYSRVRRLQFLARRELERGDAGAESPGVAPSVTSGPAVAPDRAGTPESAGPFA